MATSTAPSTVLPPGPCGPARLEVDGRCAEAERLAQASVAHAQRLRDARLESHQISNEREADARVRDRRQLGQAKDAARVAYHQQMATAESASAVRETARTWLRELDRLNRQIETEGRADALDRRAAELAQQMSGLELAADAARVAAEAARQACLDARRALADCEERAQGPLAAAAASTTASRAGSARATRVVALLLRGDRESVERLAMRLAEETGVDAGRLQLLLLELREAVVEQALASNALRLPVQHEYWDQFSTDDQRKLVASLAAMNYRFDGVGGWADQRIPSPREVAFAVSHTGIDPRTLRRPAGQQMINELWRGTTVLVESYLAACAPALELEQVSACLGPRASELSELWDMWGRIRPLLLAVSA